jgi:hypothetical protein
MRYRGLAGVVKGGGAPLIRTLDTSQNGAPSLVAGAVLAKTHASSPWMSG